MPGRGLQPRRHDSPAASVGGRGVELWDVAERRRLDEGLLAIPEGKGESWSVAFSPDGTTLAAGFGGGVVLWDVAAPEAPCG